MESGELLLYHVMNHKGNWLGKFLVMTSDWRTPNKRYWQNMETANIGLVSSVSRAPARQSGGRRFKSRSSQFFFVYPELLFCELSFFCVSLHMNK